MLTWKKEGTGAELRVIFQGDVTERSLLEGLAQEIPGPTVVFDVGDITRFNSLGVKNWLKLMTTLADRGVSVSLDRLAVAVVHQMNMISGFEGSGTCGSVYAPFYCEDCHREDRMLLDMTPDLVANIPESMPCTKCKQPMEFDDLHEHYTRLVELFT